MLRGGSRALWAVLAILGGAGPARAGEGGNVENAYVWFIADLREGQLSAAFFASGRALVRTTGNVGARQEIGFYEHALPADTYARLRALKKEVGFDSLPPGPPMRPESKSTSIGETTDGASFDMKAWPLRDVPKAVRPLLDEAQRLADEVLAHPLRVLRGEGAATAASFPQGEPVAFQVTLRNVGREPLETDHPLRGGGWPGLRLLVTKDVPSSQAKESDAVWIELQPQNVQPAAGPAAPAGAKLQLAPGAELAFVVRHKLLASPGRYKAALFYIAQAPSTDVRLIRGSLAIDLGGFEIARR